MYTFTLPESDLLTFPSVHGDVFIDALVLFKGSFFLYMRQVSAAAIYGRHEFMSASAVDVSSFI